jgi:hypothetical protein
MLPINDINYVLSLISAKAIVKLAGILNKGATALP